MHRLRTASVAVFLDLLRDARAPMAARDLKRRLGERGVEPAEADRAWRRAQRALRLLTRFDPVARTYEWTDTGPGLAPERAVDELTRAGLRAADRVRLAETVRAALRERDDLEARLRQAYRVSWQARGARERQARVDAVRALAGVAMDVEELAAAGAQPAVIVERVRALVRMCDLEPIGRAGEEAAFDAARHAVVAGAGPAGTRVSVIRPGYVWRTDGDHLLIDRARVAPV
jgi:hypothetical protein